MSRGGFISGTLCESKFTVVDIEAYNSLGSDSISVEFNVCGGEGTLNG